jgi:hypothetical protein
MTRVFASTLTAALLCLATLPTSGLAQVVDANAPLPTVRGGVRPERPAPKPVIVLPPLTLEDVSVELRTRLSKLPGVRSIAPLPDTPHVLRLIAHNDSLIRLDGLLERLNTTGTDREAEYKRLETNIGAMLIRTDPFKPEQLRVVIRPTAAIDTFETESAAGDVPNVVVRRPFIGDLEEVVVGDTPTTIALMPATRLVDLQLSAEQAFERGRANTISETAAIGWRVVNGLLEVRTSSGYDTSLLVQDEAWTAIAQRLGGPVAVIIPTREKIVIARADRPRDLVRLRAILAAEAKGTRLLSRKIWVRRGTTWVER